ncbi:hypothetical protein ABEG90_04110 [Pantoea agglomerans]|uniref:hypothetical protein n=1 Tax=Enterobacter agglomerans TaxID=549 RepID=UPI003207C65D
MPDKKNSFQCSSLPDWRADSCDPLHNPDIPHITLAEFAQAGGNQEFYLVHKIAMDISFRIEYGIFIPHTPLHSQSDTYRPGSRA